MARWWQEAVFYQIYPRSFRDSNGDGIGDLRGIIEKLDYLNDGGGGGLGVDALWISPFFASPQRDFGYDVSDYGAVAPEYGTMTDYRELVEGAHRRGMRVVLDLVVNHSSDQHPWFVEARSSRENPKHGYYLWAPMDGKRKPNNWLCLFTQRSAWHLNPATGEYFLGTFTPNQPEFDWRNPGLRAEIFAAIRFWLAAGADGYRLDVCTAYLKDGLLRSNPLSWRPVPELFQNHIHDRNRPEVHGILREMRRTADEFASREVKAGKSPEAADRVLIGEAHGHDPLLAASCLGRGDELHLAFNFDFLMQPFNARRFERAARKWYAALGPDGWAALALSNHDQPRAAFRFRSRLPGLAGRTETRARAKVAAAMLLLLRGTPFIYYGEEIGMGCRRLPRKSLRDPLGIHTWPLGFIGRDPERTPMQWDRSARSGFMADGPKGAAAADPWLPLNPDHPALNVEAQAGDSASTLSFYKEVLRLRKAHAALREGDIQFLRAPPGLMAFERSLRAPGAGGSTETILVVLNFRGRPQTYALESSGRIIFREGKISETEVAEGATGGPGPLRLGPYGLLVMALVPGKAVMNSI